LNDLTKLDPDLVAGLKMDLNRPFGDAFDNLLAYAAGRPTNVIAPPGAHGETRA
jgi:hypothetical protein